VRAFGVREKHADHEFAAKVLRLGAVHFNSVTFENFSRAAEITLKKNQRFFHSLKTMLMSAVNLRRAVPDLYACSRQQLLSALEVRGLDRQFELDTEALLNAKHSDTLGLQNILRARDIAL
jgi:hypothetical protein